MRAGEVVVRAGTILGPAHIGVLASVGWTEPKVHQPLVAILSTGDELVEPGQVPGPGQIRNSNARMLEALVQQDGATPWGSEIVPDDPRDLQRAFSYAMDADVVLVSGGVSAGRRDLVPEALDGVGVKRVFHKVRLKPGKPIWFGVEREEEPGDEPAPRRVERSGTLVFGLPGNPVSVLVGYLLFVRPALAVLSRRPGPPPAPRPARLARPFRHRGDRPTYFPARRVNGPEAEPPEVETLDWAGSADLRTVAQADGFAAFPAGDHDYAPGERVDFLAL
jgi:molybdopterin molybdotransferase